MKKFKLFLFVAGLLTSAVCTAAQTNVNPHPFTVHDVGDDGRQVVYFSTDEPTKQTWQESFIENPQILNKAEWEYLLKDREFNGIDATKFRGWAQLIDEKEEHKVKNAYAVLLPDDWAEMYDFRDGAWYTRETEPKKVFNIGPTFANNPLKAVDKAALQQAGAVFLPCDITAGEGTYANGQYWTNTQQEGFGIYYVYFSTSATTPTDEKIQINESGKAEEERYVLKAIREVTITLNENDDNTDLLNIWKTNGQQVNVELIRSLTPGMYNTLCLPFDLNAKSVKETFGGTTKLAKFTSGTLSEDKTTLNIDFEDIDLSTDDATAIEAGEPYLIQPTNAVANPIFYNRIIKCTTASGENFSPNGAVAYLGIINPHQLEAGNKKYLFLQANNQLIWSKAGDTSSMKGMRGYFYVPQMEAGETIPSGCPARLSVRPAPQTPTGLGQGNKDKGQRTIKFMRNGKLFIEYNGVIYNMQGGHEL